MDDKLLKETVNLCMGYLEQYRVLIAEQFKDLSWGTRSISDEDFSKWFLMKAQENPNWLFALPYVRGGMREIGRFLRIVTNEVKP